MRKTLLLLGKQGLIKKIWFGFPEGKLKDKLRQLGLRALGTFLIELTLCKGETAVQIKATPAPKNNLNKRIRGEYVTKHS